MLHRPSSPLFGRPPAATDVHPSLASSASWGHRPDATDAQHPWHHFQCHPFQSHLRWPWARGGKPVGMVVRVRIELSIGLQLQGGNRPAEVGAAGGPPEVRLETVWHWKWCQAVLAASWHSGRWPQLHCCPDWGVRRSLLGGRPKRGDEGRWEHTGG